MTLRAFRYEYPETIGDASHFMVHLQRTDMLSADVQVVTSGGETNLHAHHGMNAMWIVVGGRAAFYDEEDNKFVLEKNDSIFIPSGTKYWFESDSEEPLEILHVYAYDPRVKVWKENISEPPARGRSPFVQAEEIEPIPAVRSKP